MTVVGVTGTRKLNESETAKAMREMRSLLDKATKLHVGDATGIDALAHRCANAAMEVELHKTEGRKPYQLQQRSKRMVDALAKENGMLHAFVNKPYPGGVTVNSWAGSGTWGTVRYAIAKGVPVELHWLIEPCKLPDWMIEKQLTLI
ncbi:hypothetical protein [Pseudanabaena sp. PCC 6802]|uniref:hypothetical protein n=1 Tax=Pseudanabaena sp. PCC 6802 TaxID=118173 RepID=UPI0003476CA5|nr:hypothetical protein [Pseudanabaena sp. PCC 6802]